MFCVYSERRRAGGYLTLRIHHPKRIRTWTDNSERVLERARFWGSVIGIPRLILPVVEFGLAGICRRRSRELAGQRGQLHQPRLVAPAHFVQQFLALLAGDFQRPREPFPECAVQQGIADKKQKNNRQQRNPHRAQNHFSLEPRSKLPRAALPPHAK